MAKYRNRLPQLGKQPFLTDGGIETTLIYDSHLDLPEFAAFTLLDDEKSTSELYNYYLPYIELARRDLLGFILESPTWRASREWGVKIGYDRDGLEQVNRQAIELLVKIRERFEVESSPMPISGCLGPRGEGYHVRGKMTVTEAYEYHAHQIGIFAETEADLVSAFTINYVEEAIGITLAARRYEMPVVISFTVETDGRLPSGQPLQGAIEEVDKATADGPAYYMINCAHPTHFSHVLVGEGAWLGRIRAIRANASCRSHEELDDMDELDRGNSTELAGEYGNLLQLLPNLNVFGGCCGTDHHHLEEIATAVLRS